MRETVAAVRGHIEAASTPGKGSVFHISVPITVALLRALLVDSGGDHFAIPMHAIATVLPPETPETVVEGVPAVRLGSQLVPIANLGEVLGIEAQGDGPIIVVTGLTRTEAFRTDELAGLREVVVKGLPALIPAHDVIVGGSIEPNGTVLLVLDPDGLVEAAGHRRSGTGMISMRAPDLSRIPTGVDAVASRARIFVVDDALTVRELQRTILERAGYEVIIAADGLDALERLPEANVDLVLTDVEMPRMDGLTLTRSIRSKPQWANLPVVLLTTRASDADRQAGLDAGADAYIVKASFSEAALLSIVDSLLGTRTG